MSHASVKRSWGVVKYERPAHSKPYRTPYRKGATMDDIGRRAGVDFIGYYSCTDRTRRALHQLGSSVVEPAVDWELYNALKPHYELDLRKDNRSVTDVEWVEKGLAKFGCPLHGTRDGFGLQGPFVGGSGHGDCSCGSKAKTSRAHRLLRHAGFYAKERTERTGNGDAPFADADWLRTSDGRIVLPVEGIGSRLECSARSGRLAEDTYRHAYRSAYSCASRKARRSRPLSVSEVVEKHVHMGHYAGAPYFCRNERAIPVALQHVDAILAGRREFDPYVAGRRVQSGTLGPKTRLVWMAPLATTILATRFSKVVHSQLARLRPFCWGLDNMEKASLVAEIKSKFRYTYSLDFSGFDTSLSARLIRDAFQILEEYVEFNDDDRDLWYRLRSDFIHSKLLSHTRKVYRVHKGVPSGSPFTSQIGSVCNLIILNYIMIRATGKGVNHESCLVLGDDALIGSHSRISMEDLATYASEIGVTVSVEKSSRVDSAQVSTRLEDQVHFLGHYWHRGNPRRPVEEMVRRMVFPEYHMKRTKSESWLRFLSYGQDAEEWWDIALRLYPTANSFSLVWRILAEIDDEIDLQSLDRRVLPGSMRYRAVVEGRDPLVNVGRKGMKIPILGRAS